MSGHGEKLSRKQEPALAALLAEPTVTAAAAKAGVSEATLRRWLATPAFHDAYRDARRQLVRAAVGRLQGAVGLAVDTLRTVAERGAKDSDRVRAAVALLDHAFRGWDGDDAGDAAAPTVEGTADVVRVLSARLRQLDATDLPAPEKARLTAAVSDSLLRAIGVDVLDKRLAALEAVLTARKDKDR